MKEELLVSISMHEFAIDLRKLRVFYKNLINFDWPYNLLFVCGHAACHTCHRGTQAGILLYTRYQIKHLCGIFVFNKCPANCSELISTQEATLFTRLSRLVIELPAKLVFN